MLDPRPGEARAVAKKGWECPRMMRLDCTLYHNHCHCWLHCHICCDAGVGSSPDKTRAVVTEGGSALA